MDFHRELEQSVASFPGLDGIIFVDPDGEAIIYQAPRLGEFETRLAGAKMSILTKSFDFSGLGPESHMFEIQCDGRFFLYIQLNQQYSITAIGSSLCEKYRLRKHLLDLAGKFNPEIL